MTSSTHVLASPVLAPHAHAVPSNAYAKWAGRASVVFLAAGASTLALKGVPHADLTLASAWAYIGATVATMLGVVSAVAACTAGMNAH